jgi:hypothetical protein
MVARLNRRADQLEQISKKYWTTRRIIFAGGSLLALGLCKYSGGFAGVVLAAFFLAVFTVIASYHRRVQDSIARNSLLVMIQEIQMARINLDWDQLPHSNQPQESYSQPEHPFAADLDIIGERSLHRLLDTAVTNEGSNRLKSWLLNEVPDPSVIMKRQALVRELEEHSIFRDKLQLHSAIASESPDPRAALTGQWNSNILIDWIQQRIPPNSLLPTVILLCSLAGLNIALVLLGSFGFIPHLWPITFVIYLGAMVVKQGRITTAWGELQDLEKALRRFRAVFQYLESRGYKNSPGLAEVCAPFLDKRKRPSAELKRLERLASALGLRTNALIWLLVHAIVPWDFFFTYRLELLKKELAHLVPHWLDAWHELEALNSLANFAYLNPRYVFPEVMNGASYQRAPRQGASPTLFEARKLGHPLIHPDTKVGNDFRLDDQIRIGILTGSNMSGKSTFLRTVGTNLCLAYAGAPVSAELLKVSLFRVFTCIKVSDSVHDGLSYFYAEVKRLKALLSATETDDLQMFFLIDEIFRGTNSRERHIGSRAYIRDLASRRTVGLVATHDLELVKLADEIPGVVNFHFREDVSDGRMVFDYRLRSGPCPTTNALQIMRREGLPIA